MVDMIDILIVIFTLFAFMANTESFSLSAGTNRLTKPSNNIKMTVADLSVPARKFIDCVRQASVATRKALDAGEKLIEVEFPPLPSEVLEDSSSSARDIADANTRWAIEFSQSLADLGQISMIYPDDAELEDAIKYVDEPGGANPYPNVTLSTIRADSVKNAETLDQIFSSILGARLGGTVVSIPNTALYVALVSSTQELPDLEKLHNLDPSVPIVFFNLRLDILRGDLGLPLFPRRDLHYRFLCRIRTAYILRPRSFSTSLNKPPFVVNYSGDLFRCYPEPFQCYLNIGGGRRRLVETVKERPTNAAFRSALTNGLQVEGILNEELQTKQNLVWWEKTVDQEQADSWRF